MKIRIFSTILLLLFAARIEGFSVHGPAEPLIVQRGESVMLPCFVDTPLPLEELEVEWKRIDSETMVHLFQDGESRPESQDETYSGRAEFFADEIAKGNFSLLLVNVTRQDRGKYKCVVYTRQETREAYADLVMEWLVVTGADEAVSVYAGEDVILNCSVDTHVPAEELEVEWVKTDQEFLVLLFDEGENRPESQHERYSGRAEFFTDEIPKGNFSMKLRNVRTEDRGEFMCKVHTISESVNATAWIAELGFSSLHIFVVVLSISAASIAILMVFLVLCCKTKKDESKKALWLYCLQVIVPCSMISIAFVLWGHIEGFFAEAYVCSIASLMRILILFEVAPYLKSSSEKPRKMLKYRVVPIEFSFILIGLNSDLLSIFLTDRNPDAEGKFGTGLLFGLILVLCVVAVFLSGSKRWTRCICLAAGIGFECLFLLATDNFGLFSLENSAWICVTVFLCILIVTLWFQIYQELPAKPQIILYSFGAAVLTFLDSVVLATELIQKANKGERTVKDLRVIVLPLESVFVTFWLILLISTRYIGNKRIESHRPQQRLYLHALQHA